MPDIATLDIPDSLLEVIQKNPSLMKFIEADDKAAMDELVSAESLPAPESHVTLYEEPGTSVKYNLNVIGLCAQLGLREHVDYLFNVATTEQKMQILCHPEDYNLLRATCSSPGFKCWDIDSIRDKLESLARDVIKMPYILEKSRIQKVESTNWFYELMRADDFGLLRDACARKDGAAMQQIVDHITLRTYSPISSLVLSGNKEIMESCDFQVFKLAYHLNSDLLIRHIFLALKKGCGFDFKFHEIATTISSSSPHVSNYSCFLDVLLRLIRFPIDRAKNELPDQVLINSAEAALHLLGNSTNVIAQARLNAQAASVEAKAAAEAFVAQQAAASVALQKAFAAEPLAVSIADKSRANAAVAKCEAASALSAAKAAEADEARIAAKAPYPYESHDVTSGMLFLKPPPHGKDYHLWHNLYILQTKKPDSFYLLLNATKSSSKIDSEVYRAISLQTFSNADKLWEQIGPSVHSALSLPPATQRGTAIRSLGAEAGAAVAASGAGCSPAAVGHEVKMPRRR